MAGALLHHEKAIGLLIVNIVASLNVSYGGREIDLTLPAAREKEADIRWRSILQLTEEMAVLCLLVDVEKAINAANSIET